MTTLTSLQQLATPVDMTGWPDPYASGDIPQPIAPIRPLSPLDPSTPTVGTPNTNASGIAAARVIGTLIDSGGTPDESTNGEKTRGTPPIERDGTKFCPQCLEEIDDEPGYGLAYGGLGTYWVCYSSKRPEGKEDGCQWFHKIMDSEMEER